MCRFSASRAMQQSMIKLFNFLKSEKGSAQPLSPTRKAKHFIDKLVNAGKCREYGNNVFWSKFLCPTKRSRDVNVWHEKNLEVKCWISHLTEICNCWTLCETAYFKILLSMRGSTNPGHWKSRVCNAVEESRLVKMRDTNLAKPCLGLDWLDFRPWGGLYECLCWQKKH